jgi:hypothetical protein
MPRKGYEARTVPGASIRTPNDLRTRSTFVPTGKVVFIST